MKKINLTLSFLCLFIGASLAQRTCGNELNLTEIQRKDPQRYQRIMQIENHSQEFIQKRRESLSTMSHGNVHVVIPVVVHVLHNGGSIGTGLNISDAQIESQIDVINEDFRRFNSDASSTPSAFQGVAADAGIEFVLACIDPNGNPTSGIIRKYTTETTFIFETDNIKFNSEGGSNAWPADRYLNIWVGGVIEDQSGLDLLGYAQWPDQLSTSPETDGVVIKTTAFGKTGNVVSPYNKGRTATHEIGHWLNLRHVWGNIGGCSDDDLVTDTPNQSGPYYYCPSHPQASCSSNDMFMNYMDYTDDGCMNLFTEGQADRMLALFGSGGARESFVDCTILAEICVLPSSPSISGSFIVCTSNKTFTLNSQPYGTTISWTKSSNLVYVSGQGTNNYTVKAASSSTGGTGWVRATVSSGSGCDHIVEKVVQSGPFSSSQITVTGTTGVCPGNNYVYTANVPGGHQAGYTYQWTKPSNWSINYQSGNTISFYVPMYNPDYGTVQFRVANGCGSYSGYSGVTVFPGFGCGSFYFSIFPNPATTSISVELIEEEGLESDTLVTGIEKEKPFEFEVDLRTFYGKSMLKQISKNRKISIDIASLPKGVYILKIFSKKETITERILIE